MVLSDFDQFALALNEYISKLQNNSGVDSSYEYNRFQDKIENLNCNDFRFYYFRAHYLNSIDCLVDAKTNIEKSIKLIPMIDTSVFYCGENGIQITAPFNDMSGSRFLVPMISHRKLLSDIYACAGEIFAQVGENDSSLEYYKISQYYSSFLKSEFQGKDHVKLFSFRRLNEHSLSDLINQTLTVCPSIKMNDPFDSIINLWGEEEHLVKQCKEKKHVKPMCSSFKFYRIRSFCMGNGNLPTRNILMWSHYAGEHTGFCIKYKLSKHFICQEENSKHEHMYIKKIDYTNKKINITAHTIDSNLAFATKKLDWKYENEVRLIVYNPNISTDYYGVNLDEASEIEAIFFGYRCPESTIATIKELFTQRGKKVPKFYKMTIDNNNVYKLRYLRIKD